jgi:hypothetical protein
MRRVLDGIRFAGDALLTDIAAIAPLLSGPSIPPAGGTSGGSRR